MQMKISNIAPERIKANPYRDLDTYPILPEKVDALMRSISEGDVGVWPRIIARPCTGGYEMAFGHHLLEAAKRLKVKNIPIIVAELNDERMVQYMGRENGEDYGSEFLILLNTWEGAVKHLRATRRVAFVQPIEVATLLGWTRANRRGGKMTFAAAACSSACKLVEGNYLKRSDLVGLSVSTARQLCERTSENMKRVEDVGREKGTSPDDIERVKRQMGKGAQRTAAEVREGKIAQRDIGGRVDGNTFGIMQRSKKRDPALFRVFGDRLINSLYHIVNDDRLANKLREIEKSLAVIDDPSDVDTVDRVHDELRRLAKRADLWSDKIKRRKPTVVPLTALPKE